MKLKGQARHHFWGEFAQTIGIECKSEHQAAHTVRILNHRCGSPGLAASATGGKSQSLGWVQVGTAAKVFCGGDYREKVLEVLDRAGVDLKVLNSMGASIDFGGVFTIDMPEATHPDQAEFEFVAQLA